MSNKKNVRYFFLSSINSFKLLKNHGEARLQIESFDKELNFDKKFDHLHENTENSRKMYHQN